MGGGLFDPLGTDRISDRPSDGWRATRSAPLVAAALAVAVMAVLFAVAYLRDDGDRGRPTAISTIDRIVSPPKPPATVPAPPPPPSPGASPPAVATSTDASVLTPPRDDQEVEVQNGVRIIRPRRAAPEGQAVRSPAPSGPSSPTAGR